MFAAKRTHLVAWLVATLPLGAALCAVRGGGGTINGGGVVRALAQAQGDPWRGAKLYNDWRFYNTECGTQAGVGDELRCAECHGWQGEAEVGNPAHRLVDRVASLSAEELARLIENHPAPVTVGGSTLDKPYGQIFVDVANVRGVGPMTKAQKITDLVAFLKEPSLFGTVVDYSAGGNAAVGKMLFETTDAGLGCGLRCHGLNGEAIDFHKGETEEPNAEWLGDIANEGDGSEFAFLVKFGHPRPLAQQLQIWSRAMIAFRNPNDPQQGAKGLPLITDQNIRDIRAHAMTLRRAEAANAKPEAGTICP
jgi:cytochrome c553